MAQFLEISKINSYGEEGKALVKVKDIVGIKERHVDTKKLYDENGNVVSEEKGEKLFGVLVANEYGNNEIFYVNETEYQNLSKILLALD